MVKIFLIIAAFFATVFIYGCHTPAQPEFKGLDSVQFQKLGDNRARFSAGAIFYNPNSLGATITKVHLNVYIDSVKVGSMYNDTMHIKVKPKSNFTLPVTMDVSLKDILSSNNVIAHALDMLTDKKIHVLLQGTIYVKATGIEIPVPINTTTDIDANF